MQYLMRFTSSVTSKKGCGFTKKIVDQLRAIHITKTGHHRSVHKMEKEVKNLYFGSMNWKKTIRTLVRHCHHCCTHYPSIPSKNTFYNPYMRPKELYYTDLTYLKKLFSSYYIYILNVIDWESKFMFSWLLPDKNAATILHKFEELSYN